MEEIKKEQNLEDFIKESKFSDSMYRDIFLELVTKYKAESPRQHLIRAIITIFKETYPAEMKVFNQGMKKIRETRVNEFAADKQQDQRLLFKFPESLWARLSMVVDEPPFLNQSNPPAKDELEEMQWLFKEFPEFAVAEKI